MFIKKGVKEHDTITKILRKDSHNTDVIEEEIIKEALHQRKQRVFIGFSIFYCGERVSYEERVDLAEKFQKLTEI